MSANQKIILAIFIVYLALNAAIGIIFSNRQNKKQHTSSEKKFFIGGRNMNGLLLAMTTMATYTSVSSFISGPGAAGLTYGYAQAWIATVQVPITFLVLGVLGNKLALVSRRTGAVTVVGYLKARYKSDVLVIVTSLLMVAFFMAQMMAFKDNTKLVFGETIANPALTVFDIERFANIAHKNGVPLIVDNTFATPYLCRPIEWGADIVIHSTSKYMDGHAVQVGGVIVDSGKFDWTGGKFPCMTEPDESYHGTIYTEKYSFAPYIVKARMQLMRDFGCYPAANSSFLLNLDRKSVV